MTEPRRLGPDHPETKRFVERMRKAAEAESDVVRAREWRGRTPEEHGRVLVDLLGLAAAIVTSRGRPVQKEPLRVVSAAKRGEQRRRVNPPCP